VFFPRGGSAQVVRYLARALPAAGWHSRVVAGSLGAPGTPGHAGTFFGPGADLVAVPYDAAAAAPDPMRADPPMHASYEDRPGAPDRLMAGLGDRLAEHQVTAWTRILARAWPDGAEVAHMHHLTPAHEALARVRPDVPVVTHIHGTELLMLDAGRGDGAAAHAARWERRMRGWAARSARIIVSSPPAVADVERLLGVDPGRVEVVPNGVDLGVFAGGPAPREDRHAFLRRWLVEEPRGWSPARPWAGGVRHRDAQLEVLRRPDAVTVAYVGRFTEVKRVPLLIRAHARAREALGAPLPLVVAGGAPGEWEGDHPADVAAASPWRDEVFFAGWRSHEEVAALLAHVDLLAAPSAMERFGQVYVEAMAMGVPPIACAAGAPPTYIDADPSSAERCGWLVPPDDEEALALALVEAARDGAERALRGANGRRRARGRFSWEGIARTVAGVYAAAAGG